MKFLWEKLLPALALILCLACGAWALDDGYLLKRADLERDAGNTREAVRCYKEYIKAHPVTNNPSSPEYREKEQYYISTLLRAYTSLLRLYGKDNRKEAISWMRRLYETYENNSFCSKNKYNMAEILLEHKAGGKAEKILRQIIRKQQDDYKEKNIKVTLRSFKKLFRMYGRLNEREKSAALADSLGSLKTDDFDIKDLCRLARLHIKFGSPANGVRILKSIAGNHQTVNSRNIHTLVRTYKTLVDLGQEEAAGRLLSGIKLTYRKKGLSSYEKYKLAILFLNADEEKEGVRLLKELKNEYSLYGRKSLFVLGRVSAAGRDWDAAAGYYREYIDKYADWSSFFTLKAYSRLIDAYWARGDDLETVKKHAGQLADIVNQVSDFRTQFILAKDFKHKGLNDLASATFNIALASAEDTISGSSGEYEVLNTRFLIERYACILEKPELVQKQAEKVLETIKRMDFQDKTEERIERINYIKGQTYLWLARSSRRQKNYIKAVDYLKRYLAHFPESEDADYARYMLGRTCRHLDRRREARKALEKISGKNLWRKKAGKILREAESGKQ